MGTHAREVRRTEVGSEAQPARPSRLAALYAEHAHTALRLAYLLTGDRSLAEDLVQEAFARVIGRWRDLRQPETFGAYLRRTIVNLSRSHGRRRVVERAYLLRHGARRDATVGIPDVEGRDALWRALLELPERQRAALFLRYYEDLSERQVADVLECSVGAAKALIARGLARLRAHVEVTGVRPGG